MRRFKHWAYLNAKGRGFYKDVFPDGKVPVLSMIPKQGPLGDPRSPPQDYFIVQWDELTPIQRVLISEIMASEFGTTTEDIELQIAEIGLPLRRSLTDGSGTNHPGFFL